MQSSLTFLVAIAPLINHAIAVPHRHHDYATTTDYNKPWDWRDSYPSTVVYSPVSTFSPSVQTVAVVESTYVATISPVVQTVVYSSTHIRSWITYTSTRAYLMTTQLPETTTVIVDVPRPQTTKTIKEIEEVPMPTTTTRTVPGPTTTMTSTTVETALLYGTTTKVSTLTTTQTSMSTTTQTSMFTATETSTTTSTTTAPAGTTTATVTEQLFPMTSTSTMTVTASTSTLVEVEEASTSTVVEYASTSTSTIELAGATTTSTVAPSYDYDFGTISTVTPSSTATVTQTVQPTSTGYDDILEARGGLWHLTRGGMLPYPTTRDLSAEGIFPLTGLYQSPMTTLDVAVAAVSLMA